MKISMFENNIFIQFKQQEQGKTPMSVFQQFSKKVANGNLNKNKMIKLTKKKK